VHYWADLQLVHGFCCYDNIVPNAKCQRVLLLTLCLVGVCLGDFYDTKHMQCRCLVHGILWPSFCLSVCHKPAMAEQIKPVYGVEITLGFSCTVL